MPRYRRLAVAVLTALVTTLAMANPAVAADNVLTYGSTTGHPVVVGDVLTAGLRAGTLATFYSAPTTRTGIRCATSAFILRVRTNPPSPGVATEDVVGQTFGSCTTDVPGSTGVQSLTVSTLPMSGSKSSVGTVTVSPQTSPIQTTVKLNTVLGAITCIYQANGGTVTGRASNTDNSIAFTNQLANKVSGPSACLASAYFSAAYGPVAGPGGNVFFH